MDRKNKSCTRHLRWGQGTFQEVPREPKRLRGFRGVVTGDFRSLLNKGISAGCVGISMGLWGLQGHFKDVLGLPRWERSQEPVKGVTRHFREFQGVS